MPLKKHLPWPRGCQSLPKGSSYPDKVDCEAGREALDRDGIALEGILASSDDADMPDWIGGLVELRSQEKLLMVSSIDDMGTFRCESLPEGEVQVRITSPKGKSIFIASLHITL